jgi:hypothetical protein
VISASVYDNYRIDLQLNASENGVMLAAIFNFHEKNLRSIGALVFHGNFAGHEVRDC